MEPLRDFLEIPYGKLEELNLQAKERRVSRAPVQQVEEERRKYLTDEKRLKAVTVCFSDVEGRLHMLDYDKKFLLASADNLTFDGSSIRGFTAQAESDLKLAIDWPAFYWLPADIFGPGKVIAFGMVQDRDGSPYHGDFRSKLKLYTEEHFKRDGSVCHVSSEIEGFLFQHRDAERRYHETGRFEFISTGGYYHSLPQDPLRQFIDTAAEVQRAMGFMNEKDHPEVAPSQFEMNFGYSEACIAADQIQLYKLICRQVAQRMGTTASFLPKPVTGVNGSGMHTNMSVARNGKNLFYDAKGQDGLSRMGWDFIDRILYSASDICLILNSSVNGYRRLDPHFEAPNQIKASAVNRGAMVRIPLANERSARIEVRSVGPDANPYLLVYTLFRTGFEGPKVEMTDEERRTRTRFLPDNIYNAIRDFKSSKWVTELLGEEMQTKFAEVKQAAADRCPKDLGRLVKVPEIQFHHEVTNQHLWSQF
ncbi:MAG: glutamine synthetase family protein [Phycisphaerae bacterium]|jgi:glutamine synthetase|nr:glutamine synthetase [Phycisphaerae bacterium]MCZ2399367.1 glutamine synthetase family protein [Phycisphaerae bacterium]NUQ49274.1 glutamine synthetase [Phycisphaerae bacterium]